MRPVSFSTNTDRVNHALLVEQDRQRPSQSLNVDEERTELNNDGGQGRPVIIFRSFRLTCLQQSKRRYCVLALRF